MNILFRLLINALAILLAAYVVPGIVVSGFYAALLVALILGLVNIFIKPVLMVLTLPINILSLGLFTFIINALLFWAVAWLLDGFDVGGFVPAFMGALIVAIASWFGHRIIKDSHE